MLIDQVNPDNSTNRIIRALHEKNLVLRRPLSFYTLPTLSYDLSISVNLDTLQQKKTSGNASTIKLASDLASN
jgi:hypothetical protein